MLLFFFNDTATTEIYTLSLHDALPIWVGAVPYLQFIPDKDGDDKPDGEPQVLLDGWNVKEVKHNIFSSFTWGPDRKSTRLNSSHANISYAVFCLKKKKTTTNR